MTRLWVVQAWASNMVHTILMLSSDIFYVLFFTQLQIQGFIKFSFKLGKICKTYLGIYSSFTSAKLSNDFDVHGLIKDLKLANFHLSFSQDVVNRVSLWGLRLKALSSFRSLGSPEKSTSLLHNLLFVLGIPILAQATHLLEDGEAGSPQDGP